MSLSRLGFKRKYQPPEHGFCGQRVKVFANMVNPVLVEVMRGDRVESFHRGSVVVLDADGSVLLERGNIDRPVFPRSAVKALQALPLIETGAADTFQLSEAEIALACASHNGEAAHVETARGMLKKAGLTEAHLECGTHWPSAMPATRLMVEQGQKPSGLHNNCSGKHGGFLCVACAAGKEPDGYVKPGHFVQEQVRDAMESMTGAAHDVAECGTDGCSIPTYAVPLRALALAFARFGTGHRLAPKRQAAARRIRQAMARHPFMLAGTDRFDTDIGTGFGERLVTKVGAEGVFCAAFPEEGLGIAIKIDDGSIPGAEVVMAAMIERFLPTRSGKENAALEPYARKKLINWNGLLVGHLRSALRD